MTTFIAWIVLGLLAGWLGKVIMPGKDPGGLLVQLGLGVAGAFLGGFLWTMIGGKSLETKGIFPELPDILIATAGAVILLFLYRVIKKKKASKKD